MFSLKSKAKASSYEAAPLIQLREISSDAHSHPEIAGPPIFADDLDVKRPLDEEEHGVNDDNDSGQTKSTKTDSFGKDTSTKSSAYASDDIYIEDMWGELVKAQPGQAHEDQSSIKPCYIPRIPDQSIPDDIPGPSMPSLPSISAAEVTARVGNFLKRATEKFLDNVAQMQGPPRRRNPPRG